MKIIFDLDGTLIDSKLRLYKLFCYLIPQSTFTFDEYWSYKFEGKSNVNILEEKFGFKKAKLERFNCDWMGLIEQQEYLEYDTLLPGVKDFLISIKKEADIYLCTARQFHESTIKQLESLELKDFFVKVLVTQQLRTKSELIFSEVLNLSKEDWLVGDMGKDIIEGKSLGLRTCAVLTGFMVEEKLKQYAPDLILSSVTKFSQQLNTSNGIK